MIKPLHILHIIENDKHEHLNSVNQNSKKILTCEVK